MTVSLAFGGLTATRADGTTALFVEAVDANPATDVPADSSHVARFHYVNVNVDMLFDANKNPRNKQSLPEISLNLFPDVIYTGVLTGVQKDATSTSWTGRLKGESGYFYLVVVEGVFIAHVASPEGIYEVSWAGDNLYRAIQIDQSKFVDHDPAWTFDPPGDVSVEGDLGPEADGGGVIDIMVVYTDDARAAEGSTAAMKARIALAVLETNTSYANAGVHTSLRLVHVQEYSYVETGDLATDLSRLTSTTDAYFNLVHSFRNTYRADMVSLIVENGGSYCGLAGAIMATATNAFQVTARSCATGYYSFGHEFGHLQGARHDLYVDTGTTPYVYGHGYVHTGATAAQRWRTIMAYDTKCSDLGYNCTRLQWWANPTRSWLGAPMGVTGSSENYRVLNNTAATVANFRTAIIGANFSSTFTDAASAAGWSAAYGAWVLTGANYYYSNGVPGYFASAKHTGIYGDLTYTVRMKRMGNDPHSAQNIIIRGNPLILGGSKTWSPSYFFEYANDGMFSVWKIDSSGIETNLKPWTSSTAIFPSTFNTLKVVAVGTLLKFYINNVLVYLGTDYAYLTGQVGFSFYRDVSSPGSNLFVDSATLSTTPTARLDNLDEQVEQGVEILGGSIRQSP